MIYQFRTAADDALFVLNTAEMKWGRASTILAAPTVAAAENSLANYQYLEEGILVPMGGGRYSLDGRTPKTEGKGAGLSTVGLMAVPFEDKFFVYLLPNVPVKEDTFKINMPEEAQKFIKCEVRQPEQAQKPGAPPASINNEVSAVRKITDGVDSDNVTQ